MTVLEVGATFAMTRNTSCIEGLAPMIEEIEDKDCPVLAESEAPSDASAQGVIGSGSKRRARQV